MSFAERLDVFDPENLEQSILDMIDEVSSSSLGRDKMMDARLILDVVEGKFEDFSISGRGTSRNINEANELLTEIEEFVRRRIMRKHFAVGIDQSDAKLLESDKVQLNLELASIISKVNKAKTLSVDHKNRISKALLKAQSVIFDPMGSYDKALDGMEKAGKSLGKFGEDAKPFISLLEMTKSVFSGKKSELKKLTLDEKPKQIEDKSGELELE